MLSGRKISRRKLFIGFTGAAFISLLVFTGPVFAQANPRFVTIGTASAAGAYYPLGVKMADLWNHAIPGTHFAARETGGGIANLNMLASGQIQVGFANESMGVEAVEGKAPFNHPINVRGGWILNQSQALFVALRSSGYTTVSDLRGKRVSLGSPGSTANSLGKLILQAQGVSPSEYDTAYLGWQQSTDAMKDHLVDAAFFIGGQPFAAISSLAVTTPITVLSFNLSKVRELGHYPYASGTIPKSMYNLQANGEALTMRSIVYLSPSLPKDLVRKMVQVVFDNIPALKAAQATGAQAALLSQSDATDLKLTMDPGVVQYAQEQGKW